MAHQKHVVVDTFCLSFEKTGIKTYTQELVAGLLDHQSDFCEYSFSLSFQQIEKISFLGSWRNGNLRLCFHLVYFLWKQLYLPILLLIRKADSVICPDFIAPAFSPRLLKVTVIHDAFLWQSPEQYGRLWRSWYLWMLENGLRGRSVVVTTSNYSKMSLQPYLPLQQCLKVVYQSIAHTPTEKSKKESPVKSVYVLHVGLIEERKNLDTLIKAFALFVAEIDLSYELIIVGRSENDQMIDRLKRMSKALNISDKVVFTGYVSSQHLTRLYQHASMYVFPSSNEGFGIPILEAMHHRVPTIVSNSGALKEISGGAALVFETKNVKDLKEQMLLLHRNERYKNRLVELGVKRSKDFSRTGFVKSMENVIREHLNA
ncbi:MAG: glycosyltransferase family 1 protein [Cyclobacteriaceae bacterium]